MKDYSRFEESDFIRNDKFMIFKHSPSCDHSCNMKENVDSYSKFENSLEIKMINVLLEGDLKVEIADRYGIKHHSPQVLVIDNQVCIADYDHLNVNLENLSQHLKD